MGQPVAAEDDHSRHGGIAGMGVGSAPIEPDEPLLRRIPIADGQYCAQKSPPIERGAFLPNRNDLDGISLYLERETSVSDLLAGAPKPAEWYVVARLKAHHFYDLQLTLVRDQQPGDLPGHIIVPEISVSEYAANKPKIKELARLLVDVAINDIAHRGAKAIT